MFSSLDLLQKYNFSAKEVLRSLLKSDSATLRSWYYPGHVVLADERNLFVFDVLGRDGGVHSLLEHITIRVSDAAPVEFLHWKTYDVYIAVFSNGSLFACYYDDVYKKWIISAERNLMEYHVNAKLLAVALLPEVNSLVYCQVEASPSASTRGCSRSSLRRVSMTVETVEGPSGEVVSVLLVCGVAATCVDDCPPCDLYLTADYLIAWSRAAHAAGIYLVLNPMLTAVSVGLPPGLYEFGSPIKQDLLTCPASYLDLAARSACLWMQVAGDNGVTGACLRIAADTQTLYVLTVTGRVYSFSSRLAALSLCRVTLPPWVCDALNYARIINGCVFIPWDGSIRALDLETGLCSTFNLGTSSAPSPDRIISSWQTVGHVPSVGFCNANSVYQIQNVVVPPLSCGISTAALRPLLLDLATVYKDDVNADSARQAYAKLLAIGVPQFASTLQSPALLISLLHRAKTDCPEYYMDLLLHVRTIMTSHQCSSMLTELRTLLDPHILKYWNLETAPADHRTTADNGVREEYDLANDLKTQRMQTMEGEVRRCLQDLQCATADANLMRTTMLQLSTAYPEAMVDVVLRCINLPASCKALGGSSIAEKCSHYKKLWDPLSHKKWSAQRSTTCHWYSTAVPAVLTIVSRLFFTKEPHLLVCVWSCLENCLNNQVDNSALDVANRARRLAASLPDPSCSRRPLDAARAKAALLLIGSSYKVDSSDVSALLVLLLQYKAVEEAVIVLEILTQGDTMTGSGCAAWTMSQRTAYWKLVSAVIREAVKLKVLGVYSKKLMGLLPSDFGVPDLFDVLKSDILLESSDRPFLDSEKNGNCCIVDVRQFALMLRRRGSQTGGKEL